MRADLDAVGDAIELSRETFRLIKADLAWALGYHTGAIPITAFGLFDPVFAGLATASSSVLVVTKPPRLKRLAAEQHPP